MIITPQELKECLDKKPLLLDVREKSEYEIAHIEGSTLVPLSDLPLWAEQFQDKDLFIVTICHHGVRSLRAANYLIEKGFTNVKSLKGGVDLWSQTIDPFLPRY